MRRSAVSVAVLLGLLLVAVAASASAPSRTLRTVVVPNITGLTTTRAECRLFARHLRWRTVGTDRIRKAPGHHCRTMVNPDPTITSQTPRAGRRVPVGTIVVLDNVCAEQVRAGGLPCA